MTPLGVGLIGCGAFGRQVAEALRAVPELSLVAVADPVATRRAELAGPSGARSYPDAAALLADGRVALAVIATPPHLHGPQGLATLQAGKHLFTAEPSAVSLDDAGALVAYARLGRLHLGAHLPLRYVALYRLLRLLVKNGSLGTLRYFNVENHSSTRGLPADHWFWDRGRGGGFLAERGIHFFDLCTWLVGAVPLSVAGFAHTTPDLEQDGALVNVQYSNDVVASFFHLFQEEIREERTVVRLGFEKGSATIHGWIPQRVDLEGVSGDPAAKLAAALGRGLELVADGEQPDDDSSGQQIMRIVPAAADPIDLLRAELAALPRAIANPLAAPPVPPQEALEALRLAVMAQRAVDSRVMVSCVP